MAARLEIEIGGTDKGGNSELKETLGLIEQLKQVQAGLSFDLFKAETVQEIREVGERLTGVNVRIGEYLNLASKATQAWRDNQTDLILDNLATRLSVVRANTDAFGQTVLTQNSTLKAYQQAFDALVKNGVDPADTELVNIRNNIEALTASLGANKVALAEQKAYDDLSTKLKQISTDTRLMGDAQKSAEASIRANQAAITALVKAGVDPADRRIKDLQKTISQLNETSRQAGFQKLQQDIAGTVGIIGSLEAKAQRLRDALRQATTVDKIEQLQRRLNDVNAELNRLGVNTDRFGKGMGQASGAANAFGTEIARIIQDAPYATKALGAIQNNFGAIGNNITRATELWGGYVSAARATVIANGQVATSSNVAREALRSLTAGMTPYLLAISLITSAIQVWTALSQRRQRELEKEKDKVKTLSEQTEEYIKTLDALNKLSAQTASNFSKEITTLETLYRTINNNTVARRQQQNALEELQRLYPDVFANLSLEEVQAGKTSEAYRKLAENIRQVAYLEAARSLGAKATEDALKAAVAHNAAYEKAQKAIKEYEEIRARSNRETGFVESNAAYEAAQALVEESNKLGEAYKVATKEAEAYYKAAEQFGGIAREQSGLIYDLEKKIRSLQQARPFLKTKEDLEANTKEINKIQTELDKLGGGSRVKIPSVNGIKDDAEKATKSVKELGDAITKIYNPDTDSGNLIGLEALERANQATENKYRELQRKVDAIEREKLEYYKNQLKQKPKLEQEINAEINKIAGQAAAERKQIEEGRQREIDANREKFAEESAAKIAELEARAGRDRIRSREQEIAADKVYWDAVERNAEKYGITAAQLTEWRKQSEAQINNKWDAKMVQDSFLYQRRLNEGMSQTLLRRLNEQTEEKVKAAKGDAAKLLEIERDYQEKLGALQERNRQVKITQAFDGTFTSEPIAKINAELDLLRQKLDQGTISAEAFRLKVASLETERATLQAFQGTVDSITGSFSNLAGEIFTNTEDALENLGKTFQNVAKSIVSDLVKIAIRQTINAALSKSLAAGEVATAQATGRAIASAYSSGATLASIATYGTAAAVGAGAVLAALAVTKGSAVAGFAKGGYTGNGGTGRIAGVVHGKEFVVNAKATKDYLPLLRAINAGTDISRMFKGTGALVGAHSTATSDVSSRLDVVVHGEISGDVIKLVTDKANRDFNRYFGRS